MLIVSLQSDALDIYDLPLDGSAPSVELYASNFLSSQLGTWVAYGIAGYSNMIVYPKSGTTSCPDLLIGVGVLVTTKYANDYQGLIRPRHSSYGIATGPTAFAPSLTRASLRRRRSYRPASSPRRNSRAIQRERSMPGDTTRISTPHIIPIGSTKGFPKPPNSRWGTPRSSESPRSRVADGLRFCPAALGGGRAARSDPRLIRTFSGHSITGALIHRIVMRTAAPEEKKERRWVEALMSHLGLVTRRD